MIIKKVQDFFYSNKIKITHVILILLWIFLLLKGWITLRRIIILIAVLLWIYLYKLLINWSINLNIDSMNNEYARALTMLLLRLDQLKFLLLNIILSLYVFIYYLLELLGKIVGYKWYLIKGMEWSLRSIVIHPLLLIMNKYYYLLHALINRPFKDVLMHRFYGIILSVLIFTPAFSYIIAVLSYKWFYVYACILVVVVSILGDYVRVWKYFRGLRYLSLFMYKLRLHKSFSNVIEYRISVSIFSRLIKKGICAIFERDHAVNKYAYYINNWYIGNVLVASVENRQGRSVHEMFKYSDKKVLSYDEFLLDSKVLVAAYTNYNHSIFKLFEINIIPRLNSHLEWKGEFIYAWLQDRLELTEDDLSDYLKLDKIVYWVSRLIIFYYWNLLKLVFERKGFKESISGGLLIDTTYYGFELEYDLFSQLSKDNWGDDADQKYAKFFGEINKIIKNKHFMEHRKLYEQMHLYSELWSFKLGSYNNVGLCYGEHIHIDKYIDVFKNTIKVLDKHDEQSPVLEYGLKSNLASLRDLELRSVKGPIYDAVINYEVTAFKIRLVKEWEEQSRDLTEENFYDKSYKNLDLLNIYVMGEIKNSNKIS